MRVQLVQGTDHAGNLALGQPHGGRTESLGVARGGWIRCKPFALANAAHDDHRPRWMVCPLRVLRASFSGELSYEINVPADEAASFLERLMKLATRFDALPYGLEAVQVLRVEKGYIVIGSDTDGTTFPADVGFGKGMANKAANFVGRRSLLLPVATDAARLQLRAESSRSWIRRVSLARGRPHRRSRSADQVRRTYHLQCHERRAGPAHCDCHARGQAAPCRIGESIRVHRLGREVQKKSWRCHSSIRRGAPTWITRMSPRP